jgi:hypothetical protein
LETLQFDFFSNEYQNKDKRTNNDVQKVERRFSNGQGFPAPLVPPVLHNENKRLKLFPFFFVFQQEMRSAISFFHNISILQDFASENLKQ